MKYKDLIYKQYKEILGTKNLFPINFLLQMVDYLEGKIDDLLLENFVYAMVSEANFLDMSKSGKFSNVHSANVIVNYWNVEVIINTFDMLGLNRDQITEMVNFAIGNVDKANVFDSMVRYLVINNRQALSYVSNMKELKEYEDLEAQAGIKIGEIPLCKCILFLSENLSSGEKDSIIFDDLFTRASLRGLKIGELLFKEIYKEMSSRFPDRNLITFRLMANNFGGIKFYKRLGGKLFDLENPSQPIDETQFDKNSTWDIGVIFDKEIIKELAEEEIEMPNMNEEKSF